MVYLLSFFIVKTRNMAFPKFPGQRICKMPGTLSRVEQDRLPLMTVVTLTHLLKMRV